ncbi:MAG: hypothetical protein EYC70_16130 [Planctomycetota bacterium]|nr:MAG: hypothetical protein EYC70_16130 [Planctomycetota bacterium]
MLPPLFLALLQDSAPPALQFTKARLLAPGFGDDASILLLADLDGDGFGDLIAVHPGDPGSVDVALSVRGGKHAWPGQVLADLGGGVVSAVARPGAEGRSEILITRGDGERRVAARAADGSWSVREEGGTLPPPDAASASAEPRALTGDFDGDGLEDRVAEGRLRLAAAPDAPLDLPFLRDYPGAGIIAGDVNGDRCDDLIAFRRDNAWRTGRDVLAWLAYGAGAPDADGDGLDAATEARLGSDPLDADTDHDGLLDGWEVRGEGAFDLAALGASPTHKDCFVYVQRKEDVDGAHCRREMERVVQYWASLGNPNPDGSTGLALHPIWLPPLPAADARPWWELGEAMIPPLARGLAHYMIIYNGGGGQAGEMAESGGCGAGAFYASFLHEFGHQVGLGHCGGDLPGGCPTYTSLMSYSYSYGFNDDGNAIHYSRGELADLTLNETRLAERVAKPYTKLSFLEKGPYAFRLKAEGEATWIDWNRNGVFDTDPVRADITDVYGVDGGVRHGVGKTMVAPALAAHAGQTYLFAVERDRRLLWRRCLGEGQWSDPQEIPDVAMTGDPWASSSQGELFLLAPTEAGVLALHAPSAEALAGAPRLLLPDSTGCGVSAVVFQGRLLVLLWRDAASPVRALEWSGSAFGAAQELPGLRCDATPGAVEDPDSGELVVGGSFTSGDQRGWRLTRLRRVPEGGFAEASSEVVGGDGAGWYGNSRPVLLVEDGTPRRLHFIAAGVCGPNACFYEAIPIGDRSQNSGWRLRRFYDEWTTTQSPVAACWREGELVLGFRWFGDVHGDDNDNLLVSQHGLGITDADMRDFDDVSAIADVGLSHSIPWRRAEAR